MSRSRVAAVVLSASVLMVSGSSAGAAGATSSARAYTFLDQAMDRYATGSTLRLVQSFDGGGLPGFTDSETYDDALVIDALVARGRSDDIARARVIGDALRFIQTNDPAKDGRIRVAYAPDPLTSAARIRTTDRTSDVGNMAWVGLALVQLYAHTAGRSYLDAAVSIARWIQTNTRDIRGDGGYTGGFSASGVKITWKSTEHNLDIYALFNLLALETGNHAWTARAAWAGRFVTAMWNNSGGFFWTGTGTDGVTVNTDSTPEDVNSWSYLVLQDPSYAPALDWAVAHLSVSVGGFSGLSFCTGDRSGVWFEGTAHMADALELRNDPGDAEQALTFAGDIAYAQTNGLNSDGLGIIASSKNGLRDCDGSQYFASLHIGATAWYLLALRGANPFSAFVT
jgi:hypothetical protein